MARKNAVLEARDARGGDIGEPDRAIGGYRQSAQPDDGCRQREGADGAVRRDPRDRPHWCVGVPSAARSIRSEPERFEVLGPLGEPLDLAVSKYADSIRELDGEPDRSIGRYGERRRDVRLDRHAVLDKAGIRPGGEAPNENSETRHNHDSSRRQPYAPTPDPTKHHSSVFPIRWCPGVRVAGALPVGGR